MFLKDYFKLPEKKSLRQNWGTKTFLKNVYCLVIKLESKSVTPTQD